MHVIPLLAYEGVAYVLLSPEMLIRGKAALMHRKTGLTHESVQDKDTENTQSAFLSTKSRGAKGTRNKITR